MANAISLKKPPAEVIDLIKRSGDPDTAIAFPAQREMAKAIETPLRQGVLVGDVVRGIFQTLSLGPGVSVDFPLDLLAPGEEADFVAYTNPGHGRIPERQVEGDYVTVPTYYIASSIDWLLRYAFDARWDIVGRATQLLEASFIKKINDDGWHTILSAGADRNILVYDGDATAGQFTKRLISLLKIVMRRNSGGNTASIKRGSLTDVFLSPEGIEGIRNWGLDQVDDITRREIYQSADGSAILTRVFGINLQDLDEFGEGQEYQTYFTSTLGGSLQGSDTELVIGLDLNNTSSLVMPIKQEIKIWDDPALHRQQRAGFYGWGEFGFACLDNRSVLLASY